MEKVGSKTKDALDISPVIDSTKRTSSAVQESVATNFKEIGSDISEIASKVTLENTKEVTV